MQKPMLIFGLFAILFAGLISPVTAENDDSWKNSYRELEHEYDEQRWNIEKLFDEKYQMLNKYYEEQKISIYEKIDSDPSLSQTEIDEMFRDLFDEFEEKQNELDAEYQSNLAELEMMFAEKFRQLDEEYSEYYDQQNNYDYYDGTANDGYVDGGYNEYEINEPYMNDPEWKEIEPLAEKIMNSIPMEKIRILWESGKIDELVNLIVSETNLSYDDAKRVVSFFEKYEHDSHNDDHYDEEIPVEQYAPGETYDDYDELKNRVSELEEENRMLRQTISELEEKIVQINAVLMEQVTFIYEWVLSQ